MNRWQSKDRFIITIHNMVGDLIEYNDKVRLLSFYEDRLIMAAPSIAYCVLELL